MLQRIVVALNSVASPVWAVIILLLGSVCYIESKRLGLDNGFPQQLLAVGATMLTGHAITRTETTQPGPGEATTRQTTEPAAFQPPESK